MQTERCINSKLRNKVNLEIQWWIIDGALLLSHSLPSYRAGVVLASHMHTRETHCKAFLSVVPTAECKRKRDAMYQIETLLSLPTSSTRVPLPACACLSLSESDHVASQQSAILSNASSLFLSRAAHKLEVHNQGTSYIHIYAKDTKS